MISLSLYKDIDAGVARIDLENASAETIDAFEREILFWSIRRKMVVNLVEILNPIESDSPCRKA
jgi:hypothetical protein